ncbi:hypothetical protein QTP88_001807 [Uroleucon formosanum]
MDVIIRDLNAIGQNVTFELTYNRDRWRDLLKAAMVLNGPVQCKLCKLKIKYSNNTSNVWDHLRRKHSTVLEANKLVTQIEELDDINVPNELSTSTSNIHFFI